MDEAVFPAAVFGDQKGFNVCNTAEFASISSSAGGSQPFVESTCNSPIVISPLINARLEIWALPSHDRVMSCVLSDDMGWVGAGSRKFGVQDVGVSKWFSRDNGHKITSFDCILSN